jgi:hypothetical protein
MFAPRGEGIDLVAPDWRALAPSPQAIAYAAPQFRLTRGERDWFFWLAYSVGLRPGALLKQFAEAYANGAPVPLTELGEPKNKLRLIKPSDRVAHSFLLDAETARRAYARAHADGLSLSAIMRRFVVDYVRRERAVRLLGSESEGASHQPKRMKGDQAAGTNKARANLTFARALAFPKRRARPKRNDRIGNPATVKLGSTNPAEAQLPLHLDWLAIAGFFLAGAMRALHAEWGL